MEVEGYRLLATEIVPQVVRCLIADAVNRETPVLMQPRAEQDEMAIGYRIRYSGMGMNAVKEWHTLGKKTSKGVWAGDMVLEFPQFAPSQLWFQKRLY